jgi:hypothetical protein
MVLNIFMVASRNKENVEARYIPIFPMSQHFSWGLATNFEFLRAYKESCGEVALFVAALCKDRSLSFASDWAIVGECPLPSFKDRKMKPIQEMLDGLDQLTKAPAKLEDGEVLALDTDGCVIQWNGDDKETYNCGENLAEWGIHNLRPKEAARLGISADELKKAEEFYDKNGYGADFSDLGIEPPSLDTGFKR